MIPLDEALFRFLNGTAVHSILDVMMPAVTNSRVWAVALVGVAAVLIFRGRKGRVAALTLALAIGATDATTSQILKPTFGRERPCHALEDVRTLVGCGGRNSFPSNHAANAGAVTLVLGLFFRRTLWIVPFLALLVAYSRIYVGVHYPADVIAGLGVGGLIGYAASRLALARFK